MNLTGRTLLLTGLTGSFGKAFIKHLIDTNNIPKKIIGISRDWLKQKELQNAINSDIIRIEYILGDIRDKQLLTRIFNNNSIDTVVHSAALKDLEFCEKNVSECIGINVIGTQNLALLCEEFGIKRAVLISTDKAVLPINTYGTSKKMAEKIWINYGFNVCRYGNVIGSSGSVLPVYRKLIAEGAETLPVSDERMTRFWFPMRQAIELVLQAIDDLDEFGRGGQMFIPKMPSIRITDLCKALYKGYHVVGIRPGEKLHEDMIAYDPITETPGYNSGSNTHFLTVEEIRESIKGV